MEFCAFAQEKTSPTQKPEPDPRRLEIQNSPNAKASQLPKIDLPEFIITGIASIDLPNAEKETVEEQGGYVTLTRFGFAAQRERETIDLEPKQREQVRGIEAARGRVVASMGSYFTPTVDLWMNQRTSDFDVDLEANYYRTKGFAPYTDRSGGHLDIRGSLPHEVYFFKAPSDLRGNIFYNTGSYKFYGSVSPAATRNLSRFGLGTLLLSQKNSFLYTAGFQYTYDSIDDTLSNVSQNAIDLFFGSDIKVRSIPLRGMGHFLFASVSRVTSTDISYIDIGVGFARVWWNQLFFEESNHLYYAKSSAGQGSSRIYPEIQAGYQLNPIHVLSVSYLGSVRPVTLASQIELNPYLSASARIRHADVPWDVTGALESNWNEKVQTKLSVRYQLAKDFPLYADSLRTGMWTLVHSGQTTITTGALDAFAKFSANDYFSTRIAINTSLNSETQKQVPYIPDFETSIHYKYWFPFGLTISPTVSYLHSRETNVVNFEKLPGFFLVDTKVEYDAFPKLRAFVYFHNITDKRYELWKGYQAPPFMVTGGLDFRW